MTNTNKTTNSTVTIRAREFASFEDAQDHATQRGGGAMTMPGGRFLSIGKRDCDRIERAGGPATARFVGMLPHGHITIAVG